jgi:hypothetical protein
LKSDEAGRVQTPVERQVELVREFERSGLSGTGFAELPGLNYQTFATWRRWRRRCRTTRTKACAIFSVWVISYLVQIISSRHMFNAWCHLSPSAYHL